MREVRNACWCGGVWCSLLALGASHTQGAPITTMNCCCCAPSSARPLEQVGGEHLHVMDTLQEDLGFSWNKWTSLKWSKDLAKLLAKQRVSEKPEYYSPGHVLRFEDPREGFGKICWTHCVAILIRRETSYLYSVLGLALANFCKGTSSWLAFFPLDTRFCYLLSQQRRKWEKVVAHLLRWSRTLEIWF